MSEMIGVLEQMCYTRKVVDRFQKLADVARQTEFESAGEVSRKTSARTVQACGHTPAELSRRYGDRGPTPHSDASGLPIHMAAAGGRRVPLLKAMLTTACERDCFYCPFRAGRNSRRANFKPEEMARTFDAVHRSGAVEGLFLSTGILKGGANTQNRLLDTAEILRKKLGYSGYLHLKIMPGAERGQVLRAMELADRVSVNLEAPNPERLLRLAPKKELHSELLAPLAWAQEIRTTLPPHRAWKGTWASTTTQFVVGAAGESDVEILSTTGRLLGELGLSRAYFEAFSPVPDTPLENYPAENPLRERRLYQASFLLRDYGFDFEELPFGPEGKLPLGEDPKVAYAHLHLAERPVELQRAEVEELMRVPGIGPKSAAAILKARREFRLRDLGQIRRLGVAVARAAPFISLDGARPPRQLAFV